MKKIILAFTVCIIVALLIGCDPFKRPSGKWVCEELNITLDFTYIDNENPKGTIIINGVSKEIVCLLGSGGSADIRYPKPDGMYSLEDESLYGGYFQYKEKDKMILIIMKPGDKHAVETGAEYTFVKDTTVD